MKHNTNDATVNNPVSVIHTSQDSTSRLSPDGNDIPDTTALTSPTTGDLASDAGAIIRENCSQREVWENGLANGKWTLKDFPNAAQCNIEIARIWAPLHGKADYDLKSCQYLTNGTRAKYTPDPVLGVWRVATLDEETAYNATLGKGISAPKGLLNDDELTKVTNDLETLRSNLELTPTAIKPMIQAMIEAAQVRLVNHFDAIKKNADNASNRKAGRELGAQLATAYIQAIADGKILAGCTILEGVLSAIYA